MQKKFLALVIDNSANMRLLFRRMLEDEYYRVCEADSALSAIKQLSFNDPDVILLDLNLPDRDGIELIPVIRMKTTSPILIVSARIGVEDQVCCLDLGADDFVEKPFSVEELSSRIRAAIRRRLDHGKGQDIVAFKGIRIDLSRKSIEKYGKKILLNAKEEKILLELARHKGLIVTHDQLLRLAWKSDFDSGVEYLRVIIGRIRRKLEDAGDGPIIINERSVGYRLLTK